MAAFDAQWNTGNTQRISTPTMYTRNYEHTLFSAHPIDNVFDVQWNTVW